MGARLLGILIERLLQAVKRAEKRTGAGDNLGRVNLSEVHGPTNASRDVALKSSVSFTTSFYFFLHVQTVVNNFIPPLQST